MLGPRLRCDQRDRPQRLQRGVGVLAALKPDDQVPYALAFYAGLHRAEISELEWNDGDLDGFRLHVRKAKSEAGTDRRPPIAHVLRAAWLRHGQPLDGAVSAVSVMSGKLAIRATKAWKHAPMALERITLYECRHTYASFLMAAGYTLKEIMEYMGHSKPRHGPALREAAAAARGNRPGPAAQRHVARGGVVTRSPRLCPPACPPDPARAAISSAPARIRTWDLRIRRLLFAGLFGSLEPKSVA